MNLDLDTEDKEALTWALDSFLTFYLKGHKPDEAFSEKESRLLTILGKLTETP